MALHSCLTTGIPMSPATGYDLSGSRLKSDSGFAVPTKLQSIQKSDRDKLRIQAVFSSPPAFLTRNGRVEKQKQLKQDLLEAIKPLERGATASPDDQLRIDQDIDCRYSLWLCNRSFIESSCSNGISCAQQFGWRLAMAI